VPPLEPGDPADGGRDDLDGDAGRDDEVAFRPPLPPEDRVWRHPSEVGRDRAAETPAPAPPSTGAGRTLGLVLVSGVVGAVLAVGAVSALGGFEDRVVERQVAVQPATLLDERADGVSAVAAGAAPSVAAITVEREGTETAGSAVVLRSDGFLVTDAHVVRGAEEVEVVLHGGLVVPGSVVGIDEPTGIAVVRVDADGLRPAALGRSATLTAGTRTVLVAATSAGGWHARVSTGVVSSLGARVQAADGTARYGMIVVDKPFSAAAPGGALVDSRGSVIGIATGVRPAEDEQAQGVATPAELAVHVADQLIEHGRVRHVWLGLHGRDLDVAAAAAMGHHGGAVVEDVVPDGPAARAGLRPGDVLVAVDGEPTPSMGYLIARLRLHVPGDAVVLQVVRDGATLEVPVDLAEKGA
jgi:S1-C subfamily serine protease